MYKLLTLWGQDKLLRHCGLLHSAYSKCVYSKPACCAARAPQRVARPTSWGCCAVAPLRALAGPDA